MALLTAEDILSKTFSTVKFKEGYDIEEVDDFLDEVVRTLNSVQEENESVKAKLAAAEHRIAELSRADAAQTAFQPEPVAVPEQQPEPVAVPEQQPAEPASATGMLQLAQKVHDDYVNAGKAEGERLLAEAQEESTRIVREAENQSQRTLSQLEQERSLLERKIDELRSFERDYRTRLKSYLENLLGDLESRGTSVQPRQAGEALPYNG
jgi:DivIVA domain-containing protein